LKNRIGKPKRDCEKKQRVGKQPHNKRFKRMSGASPPPFKRVVMATGALACFVRKEKK